jgi:hypothetical protein
VVAPSAPHPLPEGRGYAWWKTAEGERSHTARELIGLEATLNLLREEVRANGPFDYVVGHSQVRQCHQRLVAQHAYKLHP